ncbi:phospholipase/carboxylesterase [Mesonia phycicola]|uniref:Phospholipase/carboxylesterase n=1 Tax=Mesonia phycicola TaxID=579105 RepID=A0A1M6DQQ0_9FLAO|nr:alpha/beta hydrolase-fold protein [Mesonia phycicola]SHI75503.1 phospholipase/carboxylesterase [Mesonia phycicola]
MTTKNLSLEHIVKASSLSEKAPVIIMLHGYGSDENDLFSFATELPEKYLIVSAKAPLPMQPYGNAWYEINFDAAQNKFTNDEQAVFSRDLIAKFIDEVVTNYHADPNNVTLLGFSQGAILSYGVALSYPEKVSKVIALSGYIHPPIFKEGYENNNFSELKIYGSHGTVDQVIPIDWARKNKPFIDNLGINYTYSEFPVGHGVNPQNFMEFKKWLEEH